MTAPPPRLSGRAVFVLVFLPFAPGHYLSSLTRTVNATLAPQLVAALALTPGQGAAADADAGRRRRAGVFGRPRFRPAAAGARADRAGTGRLLHVGGGGDIDLDRAGAAAVGAGLPDRGVRPISVAAAGVALFIVVQLGFVCNWAPSHQLLSVLFTLVGTVTGIEYAIVAQSLPGALTGRGATCLNLMIFLGAFAVQAGFGALVGCWRPNIMQQYPAQAYQVAFAMLVLLQMPGLLFFLFRRWGRAAHSGKMELQSGSPATSP